MGSRIIFSYPKPVGRTFVPSKAFIALDFPLLVLPKNATFNSLRPITSFMIATFDRWSDILLVVIMNIKIRYKYHFFNIQKLIQTRILHNLISENYNSTKCHYLSAVFGVIDVASEFGKVSNNSEFCWIKYERRFK